MRSGLGRIGIWSIELRLAEAQLAQAAAAELEALGFGAIWIPGGIDNGVLEDVGRLLDATAHATVATGIVNVWKTGADEVGRWWSAQDEARRRRTMLGFGISHAPLIGDSYARPVATMAAYLDRLEAAGVPAERCCLAALGPKMLDLARERTAGAHPYLVTAEHTRIARQRLGPDALLAPEQGVILESDPDRARAIAREAMATYLQLPNYLNNWRRLGYDEEDFRGSDRLIDALFLWGGADRIAAGVQAQFDAGADHVCLQVIRGAVGRNAGLPVEEWRWLAELLLPNGAAGG